MDNPPCHKRARFRMCLAYVLDLTLHRPLPHAVDSRLHAPPPASDMVWVQTDALLPSKQSRSTRTGMLLLPLPGTTFV